MAVVWLWGGGAFDWWWSAHMNRSPVSQESAEEALARLIQVMQNPMPEGEELLVELAVDGNTGTTWYEAK